MRYREKTAIVWMLVLVPACVFENAIDFAADGRVLVSDFRGVMLYDEDGKLLRALAGGGAQAKFSPDGKLVACIWDIHAPEEDKAGILLMEADTGRIVSWHRVENGIPFPVGLPLKWSPDGTRIAFLVAVEEDRRRRNELRVLYPAGDRETTVSDNTSYLFDWSPDGGSLAFIDFPQGTYEDMPEGRTGVLVTADSAGGSRREHERVVLGCFMLAWPRTHELLLNVPDSRYSIPDGEELRYSLFSYDLESEMMTRIETTMERSFGAVASPDGSLLAFLGKRDGDTLLVVLHHEDGREVVVAENLSAAAVPVWVNERKIAYVAGDKDEVHICLAELSDEGQVLKSVFPAKMLRAGTLAETVQGFSDSMSALRLRALAFLLCLVGVAGVVVIFVWRRERADARGD